MCFTTKQSVSAVKLENRFDAKLIQPDLAVQGEKFFVFDKPLVPLIANALPDKIQTFQFGLIPDNLAKTANARIETITDKYRNYIHQRCLILADGFWEKKQLFVLPDDEPFALAGLWSVQNGVHTFTIITTEAKGEVAKVHNRMPVILKKENEMDWLMGRTTAKLNRDIIASQTSL